jgi:hypothetical protein
MANNYSEGTGVLVLTAVTPVIKAIFGELNLDETYPGDGSAYIAGDGSVMADTLLENLGELAGEIGIAGIEDADNPEIAAAIATKFGGNPELAAAFIAALDTEGMDDVHFTDLFVLARALDDGHGLTAIRFEGAYTCSKPRLGEFGGWGNYVSAQVCAATFSSTAIEAGEALDAALAANEVVAAATALAVVANSALNWIKDDQARDAVRAALIAQLATAPPTE